MSNIVLPSGKGIIATDSNTGEGLPVDARQSVQYYKDILTLQAPYINCQVIVREDDPEDLSHPKGIYVITELTELGNVDSTGIKTLKEAVNITKQDIGLENVDNVKQVPQTRTINNKPLNSNVTLNANDVGAIPTTQKGANGGVAELDNNGKLKSTQLPELSKNNVGLGNVDNTSDADKPISTATQNALNTKVDKISNAEGNLPKINSSGNLENSGFSIPTTENSDQILGYDSTLPGKLKWINKPVDGQNGASAYQIWLNVNQHQSTDPGYSEIDFLNSLKAHVGNFHYENTDSDVVSSVTTIGDAIDSINNLIPGDGNNGTDNTLDIIVLMNNGNTTTPKTMMFSTSGDSISGYKFYYVGDLQNAMPSNVLTDDYVDNTHLVHPSTNTMAKAEDVLQLKAKLQGVSRQDTKVVLQQNTNWYDSVAVRVVGSEKRFNGGTSNGSLIINVEGIKEVRFLGLKQVHGTPSVGYGFSASQPDPTNTTDNQFEIEAKAFDGDATSGTASLSAKEYILQIPQGAKWFACTIAKYPSWGVMTIDSFYCYLVTGESVVDLIPEVADNLHDNSPTKSLSSKQGVVLNGKFGSVYKKLNDFHSNENDEYLVPIECTPNKYWQVTTAQQIGDVIALNPNNTTTAYALKYDVEYQQTFNITGRAYNVNRYFVAFVDEDMKLIEADVLMTDNSSHDYDVNVVVPIGAKYLLVNTYSLLAYVKGKGLFNLAKDNDIKSINIDAIYNKKRYNPTNENSGSTFNVNIVTPIGTSLTTPISATGWYYDVVEVSPGDVYEYYFTAKKNGARYYVLLTDAQRNLVKPLLFKNPTDTDTHYTETFVVPNDASIKYAILIYNNWSFSHDVQVRPLLDKINDTSTIKSMIDNYVTPDIATLNKDIESKVNAAANWLPVYGYDSFSPHMQKYFAIHMMADIHGDATRFSRYCKYLEDMPAIDAGICLGDMQSSNFYDDIDWYINSVNALTKPYLTVIGNHDAGNTNSTSTSGTTEGCFTKFIQPTLDRIGLTNLDKTYYCRYFDDYKIAIIVLNVHDLPNNSSGNTYTVSRKVMALSQTQVNWLLSTLNNIPVDYHVMLCYHYTDAYAQYVDSNFTFKRFASGHMGLDSTMVAYQSLIGDIVDAWKNRKAINETYTPSSIAPTLPTLSVSYDFSARTASHFIGHFCGHAHGDSICRFEKYTDQLVFYWAWGFYKDDYTSSPIYNDTPRLKGTRSEDLTTLVCVDTARSAVNIVRIGANATIDMVDRTMTRIKYEE